MCLMKKTRIIVLGAGFGGLELSTIVVGGARRRRRRDPDRQERRVRLRVLEARRDVRPRRRPTRCASPYRDIAKPGVRFLQETITAIDPEARRVTTDARRLRGRRPRRGARRRLRPGRHAGAGRAATTSSTPWPAPSGCATCCPRSRRAARSSASAGRRSSARRRRARPRCCCTTTCTARGVRDDCEISIVIPFGSPVPPSPDTSRALVAAFAERDIEFVPGRRVSALDTGAPRRRARRRQRDALRPVPRRPQAPRPRRGPGQRHGRGRLRAREVGDARDAVPGRVRARATSRPSACRRRGCSPREQARVVAASLIAELRAWRAAGGLRRARLLLRRVRRRSRRPRRRGLPLGAQADRHLPGAVRRPRRREGALRLEPPRPLVRPLKPPRTPRACRDTLPRARVQRLGASSRWKRSNWQMGGSTWRSRCSVQRWSWQRCL